MLHITKVMHEKRWVFFPKSDRPRRVPLGFELLRKKSFIHWAGMLVDPPYVDGSEKQI
jgi:hypothetical protein